MKEEAEVIQRPNQRLQRKNARLTKALHNVFRWGNLYKHSQQGWEAFNALVKSFLEELNMEVGETRQGSRLLQGRYRGELCNSVD
jgi:hypothetical protein